MWGCEGVSGGCDDGEVWMLPGTFLQYKEYIISHAGRDTIRIAGVHGYSLQDQRYRYTPKELLIGGSDTW